MIENKEKPKITDYEEGSRLLVNPSTRMGFISNSPSEVIIKEFSPSGKYVKVFRPLPDTTVWEDVDNFKVLEALPGSGEKLEGLRLLQNEKAARFCQDRGEK